MYVCKVLLFVGDRSKRKVTFDGAAVQVGSKTIFQENLQCSEINFHVSAPRLPNKTPVEASIHEVKKRWYFIMTNKNAPKQLWYYGFT